MSDSKGTRRKGPLPLYVVIPLDVLLFAACLLTFAYFHHVRPQVLKPDISAEHPVFDPENNPYARPTATETSTLTTAAETTATFSDTQTFEGSMSGEQTVLSGGTAAGSGTSKQSGETPNPPAAVPSSSAIATTATTTAAPQPTEPDLSGWGANFPDKFSYGDEIVQTDNSYKSHDINVTIQKLSYCDSVAYVADLYIRYLDNFSSAFAKDTFGRSIYENAVPMAQRHNMIIAVNGDYFATRDTGVIVRNYVAYRNVPKDDVGALYYDGTFRSFGRDEFDLDTEMRNGLYQSMSFAPALVKNGTVLSGFRGSVAQQLAPRTGFGYYEPGHYALVVVDGRQPGYSVGITIDQFAELFGQLGCAEAFNLDGGQSSQMLFMGQVYNVPDKYNGSASSLRELSDMFYAAEVTG